MFKEILQKVANECNINFSDEQLSQFDCFYKMLIDWNKICNLTAITDPYDFAIKHIIDSILLWNEEKFYNVKNVIDIGTGAGFPGIPLKIFKPQLEIILLDSLAKRIKFLMTVIDKIEMKDITCIHSRAEDAAQNPKLRENFDLVVSRAVAKLNILTEYCIPFVKIGGIFVAQKGPNVIEEVNEADKSIKILGGNNKIEIKNLTLPNGDERNLIYIKKVVKTSNKFPRKAGLPEKKPLI